MILQYFKKKENEYKKISDNIYISIIKKSKDLMRNDYFREVSFESSFELTSLLLIFQMNIFKNKNVQEFKQINDFLIQNFIDDLDKTFRELGIGDMSIGKYVKKYVKKFYFRLKKLDPIIDNFNDNNLFTYLNSIKSIEEKNITNFVVDLKDTYLKLEKNSQNL